MTVNNDYAKQHSFAEEFPRLELISIEASSYCGADCLMCPHKMYKNKNRFMDFELFKKLVDEGMDLGAKLFAFNLLGDAFIDPNLREKMEYIKSKATDTEIEVTTTGDVVQFDLIKYINVLKFSNYGLTKDTYEAIHKINFEKAQRNIKKAIILAKGEGCYSHMSFLILPENAHEAQAWKAEWEGKVDEIWMWKPHSFAGYHKCEGLNANLGNVKTCGRPFGLSKSCAIKVDGQVTVCCFDWDCKLVIGDLNRQSLIDILNSDRLREIRYMHQTLSFKDSDIICKDCDQITDRSGSLVYSSKNRQVGAIALKADKEVRFGMN